VLIAVAQAPALAKVPVQSAVAGELERLAKVLRPILRPAEQRRADASFQLQRALFEGKGEAGASRCDEPAFAVAAQPASGEIQPRLHVPARADGPLEGKVHVREDLCLIESLAFLVAGKTVACADVFQIKLLRPADHAGP